MSKISKARLMCLFSMAVLLAGCSPSTPQYLAGNLNGRNHTSAAINYFTVNGYGGPNIGPYGSGGGYCCVMLPRQWQPGLAVQVEWETDPDPYAKIQRKASGYGYVEEAYALHKANYKKHTTIVEIPPYETKSFCSPTIHFLPCQQVKITTSCAYHGAPDYPIKEPRIMEEPAVCPK